MSMASNTQQDFQATRRQAWGRLFGRSIEKTRQATGRSIEEAAFLAGMDRAEWAAVELGHVPGEPAQLRSMAAALGLRYEQMAKLAWLCRDAWGL
jgi:hypothetical protein